MPVAHNLQSQGYIVIVPDITLYPDVCSNITNINFVRLTIFVRKFINLFNFVTLF